MINDTILFIKKQCIYHQEETWHLAMNTGELICLPCWLIHLEVQHALEQKAILPDHAFTSSKVTDSAPIS